MFAAPASWRQTTSRIGDVVQRVEHGEVALTRDAERELDAVGEELVDEDPRAGPGQRVIDCSRKIVARWSLGLSSSAGST